VALDERASELDRREAELAAAADRLGRRFGSTDETSGTAASLESYRANLERAEKLLSDQQADWEKKLRELAEQRVAFTRYAETERGKIAEERRQASATLDAQLRELKRQEVELASRLAALETLRADVTRSQQEALELRLATEELWARLSGDQQTASLTQSLGQIRLQLAEEFRLAKADLVAERSEIKQLAVRVAEQHQKTAAQRSETQAWLNARLRELEHYAGRLASRERQLDEQRTALQTEKVQWQGERFRLEQEIRRLLRQGGAPRSASAA
jgi:chromosome segregation ATPase